MVSILFWEGLVGEVRRERKGELCGTTREWETNLIDVDFFFNFGVSEDERYLSFCFGDHWGFYFKGILMFLLLLDNLWVSFFGFEDIYLGGGEKLFNTRIQLNPSRKDQTLVLCNSRHPVGEEGRFNVGLGKRV